MSRPTRFEHFQYLGDKRSQRVYDLDLADSDPRVAEAVADIMASEQFAAFSPDTLAEARNRGYRPDKSIRRAAATERATA
jgi:hypothetical protein